MIIGYVVLGIVVVLIIVISIVGAVNRRNVPSVQVEAYEDVQQTWDPNIIKSQIFDLYYEMVIVHQVGGEAYIEVRTHKKQIIAIAGDDLIVHPIRQQQSQKGQQ